MRLLVQFLYGEKGKLSNETKTMFQNSSLSHMIAISGAHIGIMLGVLQVIGKKCAKRLWQIVIIFFLVWFSILVGGSPSVVRACVSAELSIVASLCYRRADKFNNLGISLCVLLLLNPFCILDIGLQLSYLRCICYFTARYQTKERYNMARKGKRGSKSEFYHSDNAISYLNSFIPSDFIRICFFYDCNNTNSNHFVILWNVHFFLLENSNSNCYFPNKTNSFLLCCFWKNSRRDSTYPRNYCVLYNSKTILDFSILSLPFWVYLVKKTEAKESKGSAKKNWEKDITLYSCS